MVLCEDLNPNWVFGRILLLSIYGVIRLRISLSNILDKKGKRLFGLYEDGSSKGLSGLGNSTIFVNFQRIGKNESLRFVLKIYVTNTNAFLERHLATSTVIRS